MMEELTRGIIVPFSMLRSFVLFKDLRERLSEKDYLVVYAIYPRLARITTYPIDVRSIYRIHISFHDISGNILGEISSLLGDFNIIHTTGLKEKKNGKALEYYGYYKSGVSFEGSSLYSRVLDLRSDERIKDLIVSRVELWEDLRDL